MEMQRLRTFRTVATLMNFNQAAEVLNYAQSTISAQIKALENEIGTLLFRRIGKSVQLTEAGAKMLVYADKLLAIGEEALAEVTGKNRATGLLTLRMPQTLATYHFHHILRDYQPRFPRIRLDITSCAMHSLENELRIGTVDLAFLLADSINAENLEPEFLGSESLVIVTHPGNPLASSSRVGLKDLKGQVLFLPKSDCGYRMVLEQEMAAAKITPGTVIEMNSIEAIKQAIMAGIGVTVIPEIAVRGEIGDGRMARVSWVEDDLETGVLMIRCKGKWCPPSLDALMDTVRNHFRGHAKRESGIEPA